MLKVKRLLALAAVSVFATAFAVPAVASASEWGKGGALLEAPATVEVSGIVHINSFGVACDVRGNATLFPFSSNGELTSLKFESCSNEFLPGIIEVSKTKVQLPWPIHAELDNKEIATVNFNNLDFTLTWSYASTVREFKANPFVLKADKSWGMSTWSGISALEFSVNGGAWGHTSGSVNLTLNPGGLNGYALYY